MMQSEKKPKRKNGMYDIETNIVLAIVIMVIFILFVVLVSAFFALQGETNIITTPLS
jgi:hypothetical protein